MVIFRENTEDVYPAKELQAGTPEAAELRQFLYDRFNWDIRRIRLEVESQSHVPAPNA